METEKYPKQRERKKFTYLDTHLFFFFDNAASIEPFFIILFLLHFSLFLFPEMAYVASCTPHSKGGGESLIVVDRGTAGVYLRGIRRSFFFFFCRG